MEQRLHGRDFNTVSFRHRVARHLGFRVLQRPRSMVNLASNDAASTVNRIEAISLGQKMIERPRLGGKYIARGPIPAMESSVRGTAMRALIPVFDPGGLFLACHSRTKVRQVKPPASDGHGNPVRRVQAEEPHPRLAACRDISPHIQLRKRGQPRQCRRCPQPHARHSKRHNPQPRSSVVGINLQTRRDVPA